MKMTFRWYGPNDTIPLNYIRQIPNMSGIVTAVYDVLPGQVWPKSSIEKLHRACQENNLSLSVIESIPVCEDIKLGRANRDELIENYCANIRLVAEFGVKCICYNFMPVFDWLRTDLNHLNEDSSTSLSYSRSDYDKLDPKDLHLPGWDESYTSEELQNLLEAYKSVSHQDLRDNLIYFLKKIIPVCQEVGVNMAIHPDDPPWDIFGLPRVVSTIDDLNYIFNAVDNIHNGLTFCSGSLGASKNNDLIEITRKHAKRIHFAHLRNIAYTDDADSFKEVAHYSKCGSLDIKTIVKTLVENGFDGFVRPDHGRNIFGETGKPGYGLYDRALGATYLNGLFEAYEKEKK